jgi:predicted metal-dependent phosphoesterase TrpH
MYRYETHAHTAESSLCGQVPAAIGLQMYRDAGYQGMVFTDHFNEENLNSYGHISWEEKIDRYLAGYRNAAMIAERLNMDVFWGIELRFTENDNDYLVYGIEEDFLKERESILTWPITQFMQSISNRDAVLVYQAHPYRNGCAPLFPIIVDGFEVYNGNPRHDSRNETAAAVAEQHQLLVLSGSDFHRPGDLATGGIASPKRVSSIDEFIIMAKTLDTTSLIKKGIV